MPLTQLGLDAGIQEQADPLGAHRPQGPIPRSKAIKAVTLNVMNPGVAPVERGPVHHVGMGHQTTAGRRQQPSAWQGIPRKTTHLATNASGHEQQGRQWSSTDRRMVHRIKTASTSTRSEVADASLEDGSDDTAVMAQRSGSP